MTHNCHAYSTNDGIDASMSALLPIKTIDMISYLQALVLLHQKLRSVLMTVLSSLDALKFYDVQFVQCLPPAKEKFLSSNLLNCLKCIYEQLYSASTVIYAPPFYTCYGRVTLYGDVIGSVLKRVSSQLSSVVMAYWPRYGSDIIVIDYSRMNVGIVQFFMKHTVTLKSNETISKFDHVFAFVVWKNVHEDVGYFGISTNVCVNDCEP